MKKSLQFIIGNYIITPANSIPDRFLLKVISTPLKHIFGILFILFVIILLSITTNFTSVGIFFSAFIFSFFYWNIDGRFSIGLALLSLIGIVVLKILIIYTDLVPSEKWPETVAVWAYFFLAIGILKQIWEHLKISKDVRTLSLVDGHSLYIAHPKKNFSESTPLISSAPKPKTTTRTASKYHF